MHRKEHKFKFKASEISDAAGAEAAYHEGRIEFWLGQLTLAKQRVKDTARLEFKEHQITGGSRLDVSVDYGDLLAYARMGESHNKVASHRQAAERFRIEERLYATQTDREYELDADDVEHFRLGGQPREE